MHGSSTPPAGGCSRRGRCQGRRQSSDCGAVYDQHRHRRYSLHRKPGDGAGARRLGAGARHGEHRGGRGGRAQNRRHHRRVRRARAHHRRLPLQRPHPAQEISRVRPQARQVPHQSGKFGHRPENRRQLPHHDRSGHRESQAGAHRGQLGLARFRLADPHDGRKLPAAGTEGRAPGHARRHGGERPRIGAGGRAVRAGSRPDHPQRQSQWRAGPHRRLPRAGRGVRLSAAPRPDGSRHGQQGNRGQHRGPRAGLAGRHRRHHPHLAHALAQRRPHRRGDRLAADSAIARDPQFHPASYRLPGMRPHYQHVLPGNGRPDSNLPARRNAQMEGHPSGRGDHEGGGDGLCGERAGGIQTFRCRARSRSPKRRYTWMAA